MHDFAIGYYLKYITYHHMPYAIQHTYLGIYICFASAIILFSFNSQIIVKITLNIILFLSIFILASKLSIIVFIFLFCFYLSRNIKVKKKTILIIISLLIIVACFILAFLVLNTDLFRTFENSVSNRLNIYACSLRGIKLNFWLGIGSGSVKEYINGCNTEIGLMDTHNLLFQEFLSNGIIGVTIFIKLLLVFFKAFFKFNYNLGYVLIITLIIYGSIEHLLNLQYGVLFYIFFLLFFYAILPIQNLKKL
ncbi:hypothetical protein GCM10011368_18490 [Hyunsoonleella pacifica]|nr:hypothetical protein GCM10011368_18490 [Hyunsoonleella pacifica]